MIIRSRPLIYEKPSQAGAPEHRPCLWQIRAVWRRLAKRSSASGSEAIRLLSQMEA